jgi:surface antigen
VGPYVRVNLIDCRDFTHTVTVGGQNYARKGTACREADGSWSVSPSVG